MARDELLDVAKRDSVSPVQKAWSSPGYSMSSGIGNPGRQIAAKVDRNTHVSPTMQHERWNPYRRKDWPDVISSV